VVLDDTGIAYVVDSFANAIRRVGTDGTVVTIAGQSSGQSGLERRQPARPHPSIVPAGLRSGATARCTSLIR